MVQAPISAAVAEYSSATDEIGDGGCTTLPFVGELEAEVPIGERLLVEVTQYIRGEIVV